MNGMREGMMDDSSSPKQQKLNFTNIRVLVREVMERFLGYNNDVSTTMNDRMMIEQLVGNQEVIARNVEKLQEKKQNLESRLESKRLELMEKAFRNYDIVDLHRKHSRSVVFSGGSDNYHSRIIIEHNGTSANRQIMVIGRKSIDCLDWIIKFLFSLFWRIIN